MYGGYGSIWNQGSAQWPNANVANQNQLQNQFNQQQQQARPGIQNAGQQQQQFQQSQQQLLGFGGNAANPSVNTQAAASGMMGYGMNMGMSGNAFMNYGANPGYANANTTAATSWIANQQYQLQQQQQGFSHLSAQGFLNGFPGGRPPLPPGPPPPDKPTNGANDKQGQLGGRNTQAPPIPPSNHAVNQRPPPPPSNTNPTGSAYQQRPPPPPPPPTQKPTIAPGMVANTISSSSIPPNSLTEEALRIIQSAAALGMIPPLNNLNVSEELFGSKSSKGIPGLDMPEETEHVSPGPEIVDLDKDAGILSDLKPSTGLTPVVSKSSTPIPSDLKTMEQPSKNKSLSTDADGAIHSGNPSPKTQGVVWELRKDLNDPAWSTDKQPVADNNGSVKTNNSSGRGREIESQSLGNTTAKVVDSTVAGRNPEISQSQSEKQDLDLHGGSSNADDSKSDGKSVRIPLEAADGKDLVYDKRTLKQFDKKFREWEAQFENWKHDNEKHPDKSAYKQYLDQWNSWREQLVEQRRSILDKMTKARLDSKEIILAKIGSMDASDKISETGSNSSMPPVSNQQSESFTFRENDKRKGEIESANPFKTTIREADVGRRLLHIALDSSKGSDTKIEPLIQPLMPGLAERKGTQHSSKNEQQVERILRDGGRSRADTNTSENIFGRTNQDSLNPFSMNTNASRFGEEASANLSNSNMRDNFQQQQRNKMEKDTSSTSDSKVESVSIPFEWSLPSQNPTRQNNNPFNSASSNNPFMQPSGPNPFELKTEQKLPSLADFLQQTSSSMTFPTSTKPQQMQQSSNPFSMDSSFSTERPNPSFQVQAQDKQQVERIPRDPMGNQQPQSNPASALRLEANPVGMPLLRASKEDTPPPKNEMDEFSHLFSRDRGPPIEDTHDSGHVQMDEYDFDEEAEVIDYGASNSLDDMDFPRGENPDEAKEEEPDPDFSLEDSEVIDYSESVPPQQGGHYPEHGEFDDYGQYQPDYDPQCPNPMYQGAGRGRGRGFPPWGRGHPRGFRPPGPGHHPVFGRGFPPPDFDPHYAEYGPHRGRPYGRGMPMGRGAPLPHPQWYQHDGRISPPPIPDETPEIIELTPSPEPTPIPNVKIAPPNPEFERERRRSRSRSRERFMRKDDSKDRSRSRSRERARRGRADSPSDRRDRRRDDSPHSSRRDRDRERRSSPDRRKRNEDSYRDRERDRDRQYRDRRGRSRSRSPNNRSKSPTNTTNERTMIPRNPLFPSASAGLLGSHPASNPPPPRYQTVLIEDILNTPGRLKRPPRLVIIMRGLPGAGKSHIVKLIKEREVQMGGKAPRILSIDNYFMTEMEKKEKDPITGTEMKTTVMEYDYDDEREPLYRAQLVKQFRKTLDEGYFSFVIVDCVNEFVRQFQEMTTFATQKRFQVYVADIEESVDICAKRNIHKRTKDEITKISKNWEKTPSTLIKLDTRPLLQDEAVQDVEMEDVSDIEPDNVDTPQHNPTPAERGKIGPQVVDLEDIEDEDSSDHLLVSATASKWDTIEPSQEKLNKLDGLIKRKRSNNEDIQVDSATSIEAWLSSNMPEDYVRRRQAAPGQKRVRWADIEERREQERMREMGFVVGHTDWKRMMDPTFGSSALTKTKFI